MTRVLLVATTNRNKVKEIRDILRDIPFTVETLDDIPSIEPPEENGATFAENARIKALYYNAATGMLTVAEDSGLEIDALDGAPGVHSARYGEPSAVSYSDKFALIYRALRERGVNESSARFTAAVALADEGRVVFEASGRVEGHIASEPRGDRGFGYDPIFFYPPFNRTLAEVARDQKATVSHRGAAFRQLRDYLRTVAT
jgi:XTP/dITP diphosphohydrolase